MLYRLSFQQLLVLALLLIAALLGTAALQGLVALEQLVRENRDEVNQAASLSADAQRLAETTVSLERAARQYQVLGDSTVHDRFEQAASGSMLLVNHLADAVNTPSLSMHWAQELERVRQQLAHKPGPSQRHEDAMSQSFKVLGALNNDAANQVHAVIREQNASLLVRLDEGRHRLTQWVMGSLAVAVAMALGFGWWLGRPMRRLEAAIEGLGTRLDEPIDIRGPHDLRLLGRKLDWLRLRLMELDTDKARFLRHISHELKTPLTSMREGVALLHDGVPGPLNADQQEVVSILQQHTMRLQKQVEDLLRLNTAAFEARNVQRRPTELEALINSRVEGQRLQWQARQLNISIAGGPLMLDVDPEKFAVVIDNLLANAIRFSPPGGSIRLLLIPGSEHACIDVMDSGPGVSAADSARVFEPFYRGERQVGNHVDGNGIGLSIVQEYVTAHGGTVQLLPNNPGAHFRIEMPYANKP